MTISAGKKKLVVRTKMLEYKTNALVYIYELALTFFEAREGSEIEKIVITLDLHIHNYMSTLMFCCKFHLHNPSISKLYIYIYI